MSCKVEKMVNLRKINIAICRLRKRNLHQFVVYGHVSWTVLFCVTLVAGRVSSMEIWTLVIAEHKYIIHVILKGFFMRNPNFYFVFSWLNMFGFESTATVSAPLRQPFWETSSKNLELSFYIRIYITYVPLYNLEDIGILIPDITGLSF